MPLSLLHNINALITQALQNFQAENLEEAKKKLKYVLNAQTKNLAALEILGIIYANSGNLDELYFAVFAKGSRALGTFFWKVGDMLLIDGLVVNGAAKLVGTFSRVVRKLQTGFIYSYATTMIIGVLALMTLWFSQIILR